MAVFGVLIAGAAYSPMNPDLPNEYLRRLIHHARVDGLITLDGRFAAGHRDVTLLPAPTWPSWGRAEEAPTPPLGPSDVAYLIHTSGSTGIPKGVLVDHAGLANVCAWIAEALELGAGERCLFKTPVSFDAAARELYPTLIAGGTLVIADTDAHRDIAVLRRNLTTSRATVLHCVPSQLEALMAQGPLPSTVKTVMCGGESLRTQIAKRFRARETARLWNVYGPTEATVDATALAVEGDADLDCMAIGRPIPNMTAIIADRSGKPVPVGAIGEIYLRGVGVARGYLNGREGEPAFSLDPSTGERRYATGDLGRIGPGGAIQFLGRRDRQLKRNGVRLEPAVIERTALECPMVGAARVVSVESSGHGTRLIAFVTPAAETDDPPPTGAEADACERTMADWRSVFEASYESLAFDENPRENTHGWLDSVDRIPIPREEVLSAADEVATRIRRWEPRRVLEIGCGTGLLLFRIAPHCAQYDAIDFAQRAIDYIEHHARETTLTNVRLKRASAPEFVPDAGSAYDAIILNSVVQYLGSPAVLARLLDGLTPHLAPGGFFFVGDVRDLRLSEAAFLHRTMRRAGPTCRWAAIASAAAIDRERDEELCLDPAFFVQWVRDTDPNPHFAPPLIEPRTSRGDNELAKYRFDVTLVKQPVSNGAPPSRMPLTSVGRYRSVLIADEVGRTRRSARVPPTASMTEWLDALPPEDDALDRRFPAEALADAAQRRAPEQTGGRLLCRITREADCFEVLDTPGDAHAFEVASSAGYDTGEESRAWKPRRFRRFFAHTEDIAVFLRARLPGYEMPDHVLPLPVMPLTVHGKMDGEFLRVVAEDIRGLRCTLPPANEPSDALEALIGEVFSSVVGASFDVRDDFFLMGGHSLLATQARARLAKRLAIDIPLRLLFEAPTPRSLAAELRKLVVGATTVRPAIEPRPNRAAACPSYAQARLWFIEKLGTAKTVYNIFHVMRLDGPLDLGALDQAVGDLVARHAPLRSRFPDQDGRPTVVLDPPRVRGNIEVLGKMRPARIEDLIEASKAQAARSFDLEHDRLVRVLVGRIASGQRPQPAHLVCLIVHHIVADGWSMAVTMRELVASYNRRVSGVGEALPPLAVDYYDVAAWQASMAAQGAFKADVRYWLQHLRGAPPRLLLPYDHAIPPRRSWRGAKIVFEIPEELTRRLKALSARGRATDFMTLLAIFEVLLHKVSGMQDFVVGTVIANRHHPEFEPLVGFLVNPLALRATIEPGDRFDDILQRVKANALSAFEHQDAPFEMVLEGLEVDRRTDYQAVFQVLFAVQNAGAGGKHLAFTGLKCERIQLDPVGAMFDLSLEVREAGPAMHAELEFSTDLFKKGTARLFVDRYLLLLDVLCREPEIAVADLSIVSTEERTRILRFSRGPRLLRSSEDTMPHRLRRLAMEVPSGVAIEDGAFRLRYSDLWAGILAMAERLRSTGVRRGDQVGIHVPRGASVAVASYGAQFLGAASVYVDPSLPIKRKLDIITAAGIRVCVSASSGSPLPGVVSLELASSRAAGMCAEPLGAALCVSPETRPGDPAFATFTSGSSGSAKAVVVSQRAITLRLQANDRVLTPLWPTDRVAHLYSFNYDGGLVTLFWPLCRGATVVFLPLDILGDADRLADALRRQRITVIDAIPAVLGDLFGRCSAGVGGTLRMVVTGGDVCPEDLPAKVLGLVDVLFANQYGPCEAVINATTWTTDRKRSGRRPTIGTPIPDADVFIVDDHRRLCPIGAPGQIVIGGSALADGYLNEPELTAARFVTLDLTGQGPERLYLTGDVGRWTGDGEIDFLGRLDRQVQIRGMRSEPTETEAIIRSFPAVSDCHVSTEGTDNGLGFVAYVVPAPEARPAQASVSSEERKRLGEWTALFDGIYDPARSCLSGVAADYAGWDETASGKPISAEDMEAWRNAALERIRTRPFARVLEVGAGLGLLALALAPGSQSYVATDASPVATRRLAESARQLGIPNLSAVCLEATRLDRLDGSDFDLIVLNSVVQYLPSASSLRRVLEVCARLLASGGSVFVGDVRDVRLARLFHLEVAAARHGPAPHNVRRLAAEGERLDEELQVAPEFFTGLDDGHGRVFTALPLLKLRSGRSEMARYRYDVWLSRADFDDRPLPREERVSWADRPDFFGELATTLRTTRERLRLCDVPNRRLERAVAMAELVNGRARQRWNSPNRSTSEFRDQIVAGSILTNWSTSRSRSAAQ